MRLRMDRLIQAYGDDNNAVCACCAPLVARRTRSERLETLLDTGALGVRTRLKVVGLRREIQSTASEYVSIGRAFSRHLSKHELRVSFLHRKTTSSHRHRPTATGFRLAKDINYVR